jgi:gliding motility-associated-like protein
MVCSGQQNVLYYVMAESNATYNWNVPGLGITANGVTEIEIDWNVPGGDYVIQVEKVSDKGCSAMGDTLVLVSQPNPNLGPDVTNCEGSSHTFSLPENYNNYEWNDGSTDPTLTVSASGQVFVTVWDEYQCTGSDTASLLISTTPVVDLGKDTVICGGNSLELNAGDFASYSWSTGETVNPITVHEGAGTVSVIVTNDGGCEGRDEIIIKPCDPQTLLGVISNVITPNDDNVHDTWMIKNIYLFPEASIRIYDRWGRVIFEQDGGYENDWEGKDSSGNDLPVDTYFYVIDLKVNSTPPISGNVTIIR